MLQFRRRARESRRVQDLRYGSDKEVVRRVADIINTIAQAMYEEASYEEVSAAPSSAPDSMLDQPTDRSVLPDAPTQATDAEVGRHAVQSAAEGVHAPGIDSSARGECTEFIEMQGVNTGPPEQGARPGTWAAEFQEFHHMIQAFRASWQAEVQEFRAWLQSTMECTSFSHHAVTTVKFDGEHTIVRVPYAHPQSAFCMTAPYRLFHFGEEL